MASLMTESNAPTADECLKRAAANYIEKTRDGGWGLREGQPSAITNTAEVLAVLRTAGIPYEEKVQDAINFLVRAVREHPKDKDRADRARYYIFAILGYHEYPACLKRSNVEASIRRCRDWLNENRHQDGGWPSEAIPEGEERLPSLFTTALATQALTLIEPSDGGLIESGVGLLLDTRDGFAWPVEIGGSEPSPGQTALSGLALQAAGRVAEAKKAADWLVSNCDEWADPADQDTNGIEDFEGESGTPWRHFSYSLALRVCLSTGAIEPQDARIRPAVRFIYEQWAEQRKEWRDGYKKTHTTVRGSYAAAMALRAVRDRVARLDPLWLVETLKPEPKERRSAQRPRRIVLVASSHQVIIEDSGGRALPECDLTAVQWEFVNAIAKGMQAISPIKGVPLESLASGSDRRTRNTVAARKRSVNGAIKKQTNGNVPELIVRPPRDRGYRLVANEIEIG
jgi:hypothetical protein